MSNVRVTVSRHIAVLLLAATAVWPATRLNRYVLVLADPPVAAELSSRKDLQLAAGVDRRSAIIAAQGSLRSALATKKIPVTGANQTLANVMFVEATPEQAAQFGQLPGVARVQREARLKRHLNGAIDLMKVNVAWGAVNGEQNAGAGVKIGILDTGIDHTHPAFKDDGFSYPAGFPKCQESRGDCAYVNRKIIAARSYVQMLVGTEPEFSRPDDLSPRDRVGHGTAVAMAAAGIRNTGPAGTITGVAPKAWLGNYKVFGSPGVNGRYTYDAVLLQALEDALNDGMDIVNFSIGGPAVWGPRDSGSDCSNEGTTPCDWRADAIENASRLGLTVVVSAGNSGASAAAPGASLNSVETPGTAPSAITVGASTNNHIWYQRLRIEGQNVPAELQTINTLFGDGPKPNPTLTARARAVSTLENDGKACTALANESLTGVIAVIERGDCGLELKVQNAQRAGAVAAIIYQLPGTEGTFRMRGMEETAIPAVMIGNRAGVALKDFVARRPDANVTMDARITAVQTQEFDTISITSSRGPAIFRIDRPTAENGIKPEVVAVGTDLYMATQRYDPNGDMYDPSGYIAADGTSFATAIVSGVAAMVKQRNQNFRPADIKSAIVNTASDRIDDVDSQGRLFPAGVIEAGGGKLNAEAAVRTNVTAEPSTLWFGVVGNTAVSRGITLRNSSNAPLGLKLSVRPYGTGTHRVIVTPETVNIAPGGMATANVQFQGPRPAAGIYDGWIVVEGGAVPLRIPYAYLVGDGVPFAILPLEGDGFEGDVGQLVPLTFKVTDQYGVPVSKLATQFQSVTGGGSVSEEGKETDALGIGYADVVLGRQHGEQEFYVRVGNTNDFGMYFTGRARLSPSIGSGGVVNAASGRLDQGVAPGSYISIFGRGLSEVTKVFSTPYLPLSLAGVSVSFDVPSKNLSVPGRIHFVSDGQINVQVPWELQGSNSVIIKVSIGDSSSTLVTVPLLDHAPAAFEYTEPSSGRLLAAALDSNFALVGTANPARKGQIIQIFANGLGPVDNQPATGEPSSADTLSRTRTAPAVTVGGRPAEVAFSGLAPLIVGLYQINVRIPADAPAGVQPVVITANGIQSKVANVPVE